MNPGKNYPLFEYSIEQLGKYHASRSGLFTFLLKNGEIIHFEPEDKDAFERWLVAHHIKNIATDIDR